MKRLKKICVLFLILAVTFPSETAHAFTFVPNFMEHYEHHNQEHHKLSFLAFIGEHLTSKEEHDKHEQHSEDRENCPFSHNHVSVQLVYIFKKDPLVVLPGSTEIITPEKSQIPAYRFTFSEYNGSIWQPPKLG